MTQGADLLRLLEPAVRPVSPVKPVAHAPGAKSGELPFEAQGFDSLLASAREVRGLTAPTDDPAAEATQAKSPGPLDALADLGRIENPGLRELLAQQRSMTPSNENTTPTQAA